jgi:hypothetical protein
MADSKTSYQYTYLQLEGPLQKKSVTKVGLAHTWQSRYFVFNSKVRSLWQRSVRAVRPATHPSRTPTPTRRLA